MIGQDHNLAQLLGGREIDMWRVVPRWDMTCTSRDEKTGPHQELTSLPPNGLHMLRKTLSFRFGQKTARIWRDGTANVPTLTHGSIGFKATSIRKIRTNL